MKQLSRDFTLKEQILLGILALILIGLFYYQFVDQPVRTALATAEAEKQSLQTELDGVTTQIQVLTKMQNELSSIKGSGTVSTMASYNNSKEELALLNKALASATKYSIAFADVTRTGDQIRRDFTLDFTTSDYQAMEQVLAQLAVSPYRCLIGDITCTTSKDRYRDNTEEINVKATATFYETMVGGTPDAGLPADESQEQDKDAASFDSAVIGADGVAALG